MQLSTWLNENKRVFFGEELYEKQGSEFSTTKVESFEFEKQIKNSTTTDSVSLDIEKDLSRSNKHFYPESVESLTEEKLPLQKISVEDAEPENHPTVQRIFDEKQWSSEDIYQKEIKTSEDLAGEISEEMERISWRYGCGMEEWTNDQPAV